MPRRVREEMKRPERTAFAWRTLFVLAAITDYFLFSTGNSSFTFSLLGGWFVVVLALVMVVSASYGFTAVRNRERRSYFLIHIVLLVVVSAVLYSLSDRARAIAAHAMDEDAEAFMRNPQNERIAATGQTRDLMTAITSRKFSAVREAFTPTFRRADYVLEDGGANRYLLIVTRNATGRPEASLQAVERRS